MLNRIIILCVPYVLSQMLILHFRCHTTVQWFPALWLINYPQYALDARSSGFLYCSVTRRAFINTEIKLGGVGRGRVSISHHLTSRFQFRLCSMPSIVGSLAVSRSAWFEKRDLRLGGIWIIVLPIMIRAKSERCQLKNAFSLFNFDIFVSNLHTLYISKLYIRSVICTKCIAIWQCSVN